MRRYCLVLIIIFTLFLCACTSKTATEESSSTETAATEENISEQPEENATEVTEEEQPTDTDQTTQPLTSTKTTTKTTADATPKASTNQTSVSENAILHVYGDGVKEERWFSMAQLQAMSAGYAEAEYYYKGKDPDAGHSLCKGVRLAYLLDAVVGLTDNAKKISIKASDGYGISYSLSAVRRTYIDETDSTKQLYMILAWFNDGAATDSLALVMGQNVAGEYNRTYWVNDVITIEVKTQ